MIDSLAATEDQQHLQIHWDSGEVSTLSAEDLRREARDAWSIRERLDHDEVKVAPGLTITGLTQVGPAGVNVHFQTVMSARSTHLSICANFRTALTSN